MHPIDAAAIIIYFIVVVWIGLAVARRERGTGESESFLAADRNMNLVQTTASTAATDLGGGFSIAMGGLGFTLGISGSWLIAVSGLSAIVVGFLMVPRVKRWADRANGLTTGDLFETRFDRRTGLLAASVIGIAWFTFVGGQIVAGAKLMQATLGIGLTVAIVASGAVILAYTALGGLKAVIYTDVFQMVILMIGIVFMAVPFGLWEVGGWAGLSAQLGSNPATASLLDWTAVGWKQALNWFFSIFPVWFISIAAMQRIIAARDEQTARRAFLLTGVPIEWPLFAIGSTLVGMMAHIVLPELTDPELATPLVIMELLPVGLTGIVIAAYIAAVMSTADSVLIGPVAIITNDVYHKRVRPDASDADLVRIARIATLVLGTLGIAMAWLVPNVLDLILYAYTFGAAGLFFPMLALLFWPRATAAGAFWSILGAGTVAVAWSVAGDPWGISASWAGWVVGLPLLVTVSLATPHAPGERPDLFR